MGNPTWHQAVNPKLETIACVANLCFKNKKINMRSAENTEMSFYLLQRSVKERDEETTFSLEHL